MRFRQWGLSAGAAVIGLAMALSVAEIGLRLSATLGSELGKMLVQWDPGNILIEPHGEHGFRQAPEKTFEYSNGTVAHSNSQGFRGDTVVVPKPPGTYRIGLFGGSTTHGWGVNDGETIDRYLADTLRERYPDVKVEVLNLAFDAYDAYQVYERLVTDGVPRQLDAIVVNSGINDVRNSKIPDLQDHDPRTLIMEADLERLREERARGGPSLWTRSKHYFFVLRLPGVLRVYLGHRKEVQSARTRPPNPRAIFEFRRNLGRIDSIADAHGMAVLLSTPPSALPWYPPDFTTGISYWLADAATTQSFRDSLAIAMARFAEERSREGSTIEYVSHQIDRDMFIDDCHLKPEGNRRMAIDFAEIIGPWIERSSAGAATSSGARK